jgi:hypothetical protein
MGENETHVCGTSPYRHLGWIPPPPGRIKNFGKHLLQRANLKLKCMAMYRRRRRRLCHHGMVKLFSMPTPRLYQTCLRELSPTSKLIRHVKIFTDSIQRVNDPWLLILTWKCYPSVKKRWKSVVLVLVLTLTVLMVLRRHFGFWLLRILPNNETSLCINRPNQIITLVYKYWKWKLPFKGYLTKYMLKILFK